MTTNPVTKTIPPSPKLKTATISSKVFLVSYEVGQSVVTKRSLITKHNGQPTFSTSPKVVCGYVAGKLKFLAAGTCRVKVAFPLTSVYYAASETFKVTVLERGLTNSQELLLGQADAFDSSLFVHKYRGISNFEAAVGDLIKTWRLKASIAMPSAGEMTGTCRNIYVNFSYRKDFGNYRTTCPSPSGNFDVCVEFWPKGGSSPYPFPSDQAAQVSLDNFYVSLQLASSNIQVDQARANPPKLTVNDVRPGACS